MSFAESLMPALLVLGLCLAVIPILPKEKTWGRSLVTGVIFVVTARYMIWRVTDTLLPADFGTVAGLWILFCFVVEALAILDMCVFFLLMSKTVNRSAEADRHETRLRTIPDDWKPPVDIFIPTYNEEIDVLERTIVGAMGIDYPNCTVWVLDDGKRDWLRDFCAAKGVNYLTRPDNAHAKAGNINHALAMSTGEFVAVFDADFVPQANFLYRTIGFFHDPRIGCVQTPQHFFNKDPLQANLAMRDLWPDEQRLFFDVIMASRDAWNVAFSCGCCAIMRRDVLDEIGGLPTESVTEDILSTLKMYRFGYITRYLNERLSSGLAPETLDAFFIQRQRWCRGGIQTLFLRSGPLGPGLTFPQRLFFLPLHWLVQQPARFMTLLIPIVYLWIDLSPFGPVPLEALLYYQIPLFPIYILGMRWLAPAAYMPFISTATNILTAFRLMPTAIASIIRPFGTGFKVTPKGRHSDARRYDGPIIFTCIGLIAVTGAGILMNVNMSTKIIEHDAFFPVAFFWAVLNIVLLFFITLMCVEAPRFRKEERFALDQAARCVRYRRQSSCRVVNLSRTGALVRFSATEPPPADAELTLVIDGIGRLPARVARTEGEDAGVFFSAVDASTTARLGRFITALKGHQAYRTRGAERVFIDRPARCISDEFVLACRLIDISLSGAMLVLESARPPEVGTELGLEFEMHGARGASGLADLGTVKAVVARSTGNKMGVRFIGLNDAATTRLDHILEALKTAGDADARRSERIDIDKTADCLMGSYRVDCRLLDASANGVLIAFDQSKAPPVGMAIAVELEGVGTLSGRVVRIMNGMAGVEFEHMDEAVRDRLIQRLYTQGLSNASGAGTVIGVAQGLFRRAFGRA